ncbi:FecCD family ABC transporter permease [Rhodococcus zopfii]|uniref:FecCD family ABC transporter permease n=1 Tax=Rhodococcus zopfii TaxID=43772 RepID=UPI001F116566|nr:iron ABC transporter permease [Rhodococcus zopfii]
MPPISVTTDRRSAVPPGLPNPPRPTRSAGRVAAYAFVVPAVALIAVVIAAVSLGPVTVPWNHVLGAFTDGDVPHASLVRDIRAPRVLVAALVGAALAVVGAVMQAVFRNPLADPGITGVASGAAVGAVTVLVTGTSILGAATLPVGAFAGAALTTLALLVVARARRDTSPVTFVLVGITIGSFCSALTAALVANAPEDSAVRSVMFWINGDLTARTWNDVLLCAGPVIAGTLVLLGRHRVLDTLLLGDQTATSMGIDVRRQQLVLLLTGAAVTGAAVAVAGVIGFVGLVVPHAVRLLIGPRHALLLPASMLTGAAFLVLADLGARLLLDPVVLQTGTVAALVGSPVFGYLVLRNGGRSHGGTL